MAKENWKQCRRWSAYDVSDQGRIRSYWQMAATASAVDRSKKPVVMTPSTDERGAKYVIVHDAAGEKKNAVLARLILDTFKETTGTRRDRIKYKDEDRGNVRLSNISYVRLGAVKRPKAKVAKPKLKVAPAAKPVKGKPNVVRKPAAKRAA